MFLFGPPNVERLRAGRNTKGLIKALAYRKAWYVRRSAAEALGKLHDGRAVDPLLLLLKDEDKDVRKAAADALEQIGWLPGRDEAAARYWISKSTWEACGEIGAPAVEPLLAVLQENELPAKKAAVSALGKIGEARVIPQLLHVLKNSGWECVGGDVTEALGRIGASAVEPLIVALHDGDVDVRLASVRAIGEIGDPRAVGPLEAALSDCEKLVREAAAQSLGRMGAAAVDTLIAALKESDVRWDCVNALGKIGDARSVDPLIDALKDEDWSIRKAASAALVSIGAPATEALLLSLRSPDGKARKAAAEALDGLDWHPAKDEDGACYWISKQQWGKCLESGPAAVKPLMAVLNDVEAREYAVDALGKTRDPRAVDPLLKALEDENRDVRKAAAKGLARLGNPRAVVPLLAALHDKEWSVRKVAAEALGVIGNSLVLQPLISSLEDEVGDVRQAASWALGNLGDAHAVEPLLARLEDREEDVRKVAAEALGKIGDPRAVEPLLAALERNYHAFRDTPSSLRGNGNLRADGEHLDELKEKYIFITEAATLALGRIGDSRAADALIAALKYISHNVRRAAAEALGRVGDPRAVGPLVIALRDKNTDVKYASAEALVKLGFPSAKPLIVDLADPSPEIRQIAALVLGRIGYDLAVEPLILSLNDEDRVVRETASEALVKIGAGSIRPLIDTLKQQNGILRNAAVKVLERLDWQPGKDEDGAYFWVVKREWGKCVEIAAPAVQPLIAEMKFKQVDIHDGWRVREALVEALGKIGAPAVHPLIEALKDEDEQTSLCAVEALGRIGPPAVQPLVAQLSDGNFVVYKAAAEALGKIGDPRAVEPLILALKDGCWYAIRKAAADALGKICDPRAVEPLIQVLADEYSKVREAAADSLARIGTTAVEPLIDALKSKEWRIRKGAAEVLGKIGDDSAVQPLIALLEDDDRDARRSCAWSLISLSKKNPLDDAIQKKVLSVLP